MFPPLSLPACADSAGQGQHFAPNPNRTNVFIRVLVEDEQGEIWDMKHDMYREDRYPYFFYARQGKINRRIDDKKGYQRDYAA